jgi:hypothetical protein
MLDKGMCESCIHIFTICDTICTTHEIFQLFKICDPSILGQIYQIQRICKGHIF